MLITRVITAVVLLGVLIPWALWSSPLGFAAGCLVICVWCLKEWSQLLTLPSGAEWAAPVALAVGGLVWLLDGWMLPSDLLPWLCIPAAILWLFWVPWRISRVSTPRGWVGLAFALLACLAAFVSLWEARLQGLGFLLSVLLLVWIADTGAYFSGRAFGRSKLAPSISPGKTWAGVVGAVVLNLVYAVSATLYWPDSWPHTLSWNTGWVGLFAATLLMTLVAVWADLHQSLLKRQAGVKDSGRLLPGHGGVFDRIDALLAVLPLALLALWWADTGGY
ncbi:CdsA CDP-diglyceride synthetase [Burkholderiales bacterium]